MDPRSPYGLAERMQAFAVHVLTASGVAFGLLALLAAHERRFSAMFLWLGIALIVDGIDGPLARRLRVREVLPHWSGDILDLVVDYLNYVMVPAYALLVSGLMPPLWSYAASAAIAMTGALYFADLRMKTADSYFRGFPACWNLVVFYLFLLKPSPAISAAAVAVFCALTFVPATFLHPLRVKRLRWLTMILLSAWAVFALLALGHDLAPPAYAVIALGVIGLYFLAAGFLRTRL
ncbi:MAG: CDP-alcohol phosphatidyltransferase family protein [Xanthobacteraceae bacterium]|nr:CDP-alcohol phosphatidyltransferase family protein [Xanthobacteraceae bacterium]